MAKNGNNSQHKDSNKNASKSIETRQETSGSQQKQSSQEPKNFFINVPHIWR